MRPSLKVKLCVSFATERLNANRSKIKPCNVWAQVGSKKAQRHLKAATSEEKYPSCKYTATTETKNEHDALIQSISLTDSTHFIRFSKEEDICVKITSFCDKLILLMLLMYILISTVLDVKRNQQINVT